MPFANALGTNGDRLSGVEKSFDAEGCPKNRHRAVGSCEKLLISSDWSLKRLPYFVTVDSRFIVAESFATFCRMIFPDLNLTVALAGMTKLLPG